MAGTLRIGTHQIGDDTPCYVIAEIGHNHQGRVEKARELFREAKLAGADAVKLQKRDNRALYTQAAYDRPYDNENSFGATYGEHREFLEFGRSEYRDLQGYATELGIDFFATAFDVASADFLQSLDVPAFKIASGDVKSTPLLEHVASFGKPMIISTGGALLEDVQRAYDTVMAINPQLGILQCTAGYPAAFEELGLRVITQYRERFAGAVIGFSGHDSGIAMPLAAYVLGARIVEKHFTLDREMPGPDHRASSEPAEFAALVRGIRAVESALGDGCKRPAASEHNTTEVARKSLVAACDLPAGTTLTAEMLATLRPGTGLSPALTEQLIGRRLRHAITAHTPLTFQMLA